MKTVFKNIFCLVAVATLPLVSLKASSQGCRGRLSLQDQTTLYHLTLDALKECLVEMKADGSAEKIEELRKLRPHIIHVVGSTLKKAKGRIHLSLCYQDHSHFLRCTDVLNQLKEKQKLADLYATLITQPLKPAGVETYGKFIALSLAPKELLYEGKPVTTALHISLIKIRENEDLSQKILLKLQKKIEGLPAFKLEKAICNKRMQNRYDAQGSNDQSHASTDKILSLTSQGNSISE